LNEKRTAWLFNILEKYLIRRNHNNDKLKKYAVVAIAKILYPEEVDKLRRNICPFCGRKYSKTSGLVQHYMSKYRCRSMLWAMMLHIIEEYYNAVGNVIRCGPKRPRYKIVVNGKTFRFNRISDAASKYVELCVINKYNK